MTQQFVNEDFQILNNQGTTTIVTDNDDQRPIRFANIPMLSRPTLS